MNTIENMELPEWPPLAIGAVIICIGLLLLVIGVCKVTIDGLSWCWARLKKEPRTHRG